MLCRVADSLFWMSRYFERAENTARLMDVNLQLMLEAHQPDDVFARSYWEAFLVSTGDFALFESLFDEINATTVTEFTTFSKKNPSSLLSCILAARENARFVRDQISPEMWEVINQLYLDLQSSNAKRVWKKGAFEFYEEIKEYSHLFQGVAEATFLHRTGYDFMQAGKFLERAEKTSRILLMKELLDQREKQKRKSVMDIAEWIAILRACSGLEAYNQIYVSSVTSENVVELLIQAREFPRSVLFSLNQLQLALHAISGCPVTHFSNEAERRCGRLISNLNYAVKEDIMGKGLETFLRGVQSEIDTIALEISNRYMFFPIVDPAAEVHKSA